MKRWFKWCSAIFGATLAIAYLLPALGADPSRWICSAHTIKGNASFSAISVSSSMEREQEGPFTLHIFITPMGKPEIVLEDVYLSEGKKQRRLDYEIRLERDLNRIVFVTKKKFQISADQRLTLYFLVDGKRHVVTADLITYLLHL